MINIGGLPR